MLDRRNVILTATAMGFAAPARAMVSPTVVELFTSQGCSSCPPADQVLSRLAARSDVIALAFHVDYWDYIGWKDPFASRANTQRQRDYATAFRNRSVYTPQMVFDGRLEQAVQSDDVADSILSRLESRDPSLGVIMVRSSSNVMIKVDPLPLGTQVWAAAYQPHAETSVRRGENAGRTLRNANIVRQFRALEPSTTLKNEFVWTDADPALGLAVWVQDQGLGPVRGAAALAPGGSMAA